MTIMTYSNHDEPHQSAPMTSPGMAWFLAPPSCSATFEAYGDAWSAEAKLVKVITTISKQREINKSSLV